MAVGAAPQSSHELRQLGNELYKAGRLHEAIEHYKLASKLAPTESAPLSNLSAAYYEQGAYNACFDACTSALAMLGTDSGSAKQKLYLRQARSSIYLFQIEQARFAISSMDVSEERKALQAGLDAYGTSEAPRTKADLTKIILDLPRYKPQVQDALEYYVVGHDNPTPLYDTQLLRSNRPKVSLMFGGIGDGRNLHATLLHIAEDKLRGRVGEKQFHFTLVDIKPTVIARNLIILLLLHGLSRIPDTPRTWKHAIMPCLYYTYFSPIMPARLSVVLRKHIKFAIDMLEDKSPLPSYVDIPHLYRSDVLRVLREWLHDAAAEWPAARLKKEIVQQRSLEKAK